MFEEPAGSMLELILVLELWGWLQYSAVVLCQGMAWAPMSMPVRHSALSSSLLLFNVALMLIHAAGIVLPLAKL